MMLALFDWQNLSELEKKQILARPVLKKEVQAQVSEIINSVRQDGDEALYRFSSAFDKVQLKTLSIEEEEIAAAQIDALALDALTQAIRTISNYHQATAPQEQECKTAAGVSIKKTYRPIETVGLYVPGGNKTPLLSSLLMQAIPALIAGCPNKLLCTPPNPEAKIDPHILVAARLCAIDTIYPLGGAQAIAAMAYGTQSINKADKLFGPGNSWVTEAKTQVSMDPNGAAIDLPAGPSEVLITADPWANPEFIAADLLAQAEHGFDSQVILLCEDTGLATAVRIALMRQLEHLSRQSLIRQALQHARIIICRSIKEQQQIINNYAPEHLIVAREDAQDWPDYITAAGTIFLGSWAAESMGDYITGSNHVLPTNGFARNHSGLSTIDFMKAITVQSIQPEGILALGKSAIQLALIEGLDAHANAIQLRLSTLEK